MSKSKKPETPYEYQERKAREKRLAEIAAQFPNQKVGTILQGGNNQKFPSMQVMRPGPGAPLKLPNGMPTPGAANPKQAGHEGQTPNEAAEQQRILSNNGESSLPTAADFYQINQQTKE